MTCFYNSKSSFNGSASPFEKLEESPSALRFAFYSLLCSPLSSLFLTFAPYYTSLCYRKPVLRHLALVFAQGPIFPGPEAPASTLIISPNNDLFQKFLQTFMKKAQAPAIPAIEARHNTNRSLKTWNPNLYYSHMHMEYYYFY